MEEVQEKRNEHKKEVSLIDNEGANGKRKMKAEKVKRKEKKKEQEEREPGRQ